MDIRSIETNYLTRWYTTPDKTHTYQVGGFPLCWGGCNIQGTMTHIWWECPKIHEYWEEVQQYIVKMIKEKDIDDPSCLFHITNKTI